MIEPSGYPRSRELNRILAVGQHYWPQHRFYDRQEEMIESVALSRETVVVAGNQLGKDYTAGFIVLTFFLHPWLFFPQEHFWGIDSQRYRGQPSWQVHTRRVVTTSVDGDQLRNLWGEISRFIGSSRVPLSDGRGGPLRINMRDISLAEERVETGQEPLNYLIGRVTATGEGMAGAHAAYNLMVIDEASGSDNQVKEFADGWAKKFLIFGNPNPTENFFRRMVDGGNIKVET